MQPATSTRNRISVEQLRACVGKDAGISRWFEISQERIDRFAELTEDPQWIHVDVERAARESPFGGTIAHGFLVLSMLSAMALDVLPRVDGAVMGINYGFDKVRFVMPVHSGARIRGRFTLKGLEPRGGDRQLLSRYAASVEIDGVAKPAIACEWLDLIILHGGSS
ncbi:MAG: MaoC family dehydratase [Rhodanobacteraceae bacterium]